MKERPILFSGEMVRAILDGRKTQTRRIVKPGWIPLVEEVLRVNGKWVFDVLEGELKSPFGRPGDHLWVRETAGSTKGNGITTVYRADGVKDDSGERTGWWFGDRFIHGEFGWIPSIHMPRSKSRITLEITDVRVERLQEISEADAKAEGIDPQWPYKVEMVEDGDSVTRAQFSDLWDSVYEYDGPRGWDANPWVWVIDFKKIEASNG